MRTIKLNYQITADHAVDGFNYFVAPSEDAFDAAGYAEAYGLDSRDFDEQTLKSVNDAINNNYGNSTRVRVDHEIFETDI